MTDLQFTVGYERKYSDGNYGSEGLSLSLVAPVAFDFTDEQAIDYADHLRKVVLSFLAGSAAERVAVMARRELNPPAPRQPVASAANGAPSGSLEDLPF